jgi:hypothetical protein
MINGMAVLVLWNVRRRMGPCDPNIAAAAADVDAECSLSSCTNGCIRLLDLLRDGNLALVSPLLLLLLLLLKGWLHILLGLCGGKLLIW